MPGGSLSERWARRMAEKYGELASNLIEGRHGKEGRWFVIVGHYLFDAPHDSRVEFGDIPTFARIAGKVVEFDLKISFGDILTHPFPISQTYGLLAAITIEVPEEEFMLTLNPATGQSWQEADSIGGMARAVSTNLN